jgi:hypothetical protein
LVSGGGTQTTNEAGQITLVGGTQKFIDPGYICLPNQQPAGGPTTTSLTCPGLVNGTTYTVAVAGIDSFGNTGPLSTPDCQMPMAVTDFWNEYRDDGGQAGGGFCNVRDLRSPATAAPVIVFGVWAALATVRRRKKK